MNDTNVMIKFIDNDIPSRFYESNIKIFKSNLFHDRPIIIISENKTIYINRDTVEYIEILDKEE
ncbi:hypothetical protein GCM10028868_18270 [Virgibacillus kimchii]